MKQSDYKNEKVILFPKWKIKLEKESRQALEDKNFKKALEKFNELLHFKVSNHEIIMGKLICLIELEQFDEAEDICLSEMKTDKEMYYHYLHIYLTVLFQTSQYDLVMEWITKELATNSVPELMVMQFNQLYELSKKMHESLAKEKTARVISDFWTAFQDNNYSQQWFLVDRMQKMNITPSEKMISLLQDENVHPVVKTAIIQWLQQEEVSKSIHIHKFGQHKILIPIDLTKIKSHSFTKKTVEQINHLEQKNPSLFQLVEKLIYRYVYVIYPFFPPNKEIKERTEAFMYLGEQYLNLQPSVEYNKVNHNYIEEIEICESLYLSVIDE